MLSFIKISIASMAASLCGRSQCAKCIFVDIQTNRISLELRGLTRQPRKLTGSPLERKYNPEPPPPIPEEADISLKDFEAQ